MIAAPEQKLTSAAYEFIAAIIYEHSRIRLGPDKQALVNGRLSKRLRALGYDSFEAYCALLKSPAGAGEIGPLVDAISTNHTHFFREVAHVDFLRDQVLPEFGPALTRAGGPVRVWSAACSSGEEPYTLAIVLAEFARTHGAMEWQITATDISTRVLAKAHAGIYKGETLHLPDPALLPRYFQKGSGESEGFFRVKDTLRRQIAFHQLNLLHGQFPFGERQHVIFCRNVMIYFDAPTQQELVTKLVEHLVPGGYLIVGASESLMAVKHPLRGVQPAIYRKP